MVDDEDYRSLSQHKWFLSDSGYATSNSVLIHKMARLLMNVPEGKFVDHKDGNKLNNQKSNLRIASVSQNGMNKGKLSNNKSGFKGVYWDLITKNWRAEIRANNKRIRLGRFKNIIDAAKAYNEAAKIYHKEFAYLNKV